MSEDERTRSVSCEPIFFHNEGEIPVHIDVLTTFGDNENNAEALCREAALSSWISRVIYVQTPPVSSSAMFMRTSSV